MLQILYHVATVQLEGNLIPTHVLQVENSQMKITSCIRYFNGCPLHSCQHQANHPMCASRNVTLILNKLNLILIYYIHDEVGWSCKYYLCMFQSILELIVLLKSCLCAVACSISCPIVWCAIIWCGEWIWCRACILHWWLNLHYLLYVWPVSQFEDKKIFY